MAKKHKDSKGNKGDDVLEELVRCGVCPRCSLAALR